MKEVDEIRKKAKVDFGENAWEGLGSIMRILR
jgi:hypothetical protein